MRRRVFFIMGVCLALGIFSARAFAEFHLPRQRPSQEKTLTQAGVKPPLELVAESELRVDKFVKSADMSYNGQVIVLTDGHDLIYIRPEDLSEVNRTTVEQDWYLDVANIVVSKTAGKVLAGRQVTDFGNPYSSLSLNLTGTIEKGVPWAEPLALSPDNTRGLFLVHSFFSSGFDREVVFDLKTGEPIHKSDGGDAISNAYFLSNDVILLFDRNGTLSQQDISSGEIQTVFSDSVAGVGKGKNLSVQWSNDRSRVAFSGVDNDFDHQVKVYSYPEFDLLFEDRSENNAVFVDEGRIFYQAIYDTGILCGCGRHNILEPVFRLADVQTGRTMANIKRRDNYDFVLMDPGRKYVFGITRDKIVKLRLPVY